MSLLEPKFTSGEENGTGWSKRIPWTDDECILLCLENCEYLCGLDKNQVQRLMKEYSEKCGLE